jgi:ABC-type multidrug transport system fused ATPase/permease subunit
MVDLSRYSDRPLDFMYRFIRRRRIAHFAILTCVLVAVVCSVSAQYGVKFLVDALSEGVGGLRNVWIAFLMLVLLIAADNLLWRIASLIANFSFVGITGDLRRDMFSHLTGHAPGYGDIQCRLRGGKYVRLEHIAAMCRDSSGDCVRRSHQRADIGHIGNRGGCNDRGDVPHGRREGRCITILPARRRRSTAKW